MNMYPVNDELYPWSDFEDVYHGPFGTLSSQFGGEYEPSAQIPWRDTHGGTRQPYGASDWRHADYHRGGTSRDHNWGPLAGQPEFGMIDFGSGQGIYYPMDLNTYGDHGVDYHWNMR